MPTKFVGLFAESTPTPIEKKWNVTVCRKNHSLVFHGVADVSPFGIWTGGTIVRNNCGDIMIIMPNEIDYIQGDLIMLK